MSSTGQLTPGTKTPAPPQEIDIQTNVTVFFRPDAVDGVAEAEQAMRDILGDRSVDSLRVFDSDDAWIAAQEIAATVPNGLILNQADRNALGEVARIVVTDQETRNALTDDIEDSMLVAAVAFVVGVRPAGDGRAATAWDTWEVLGFYWTPAAP